MGVNLGLLLLALTWWSSLQTSVGLLEELVVPNCESMSKFCDKDESKKWTAPHLCSCKEDCDIFGDCCIDWGLSSLKNKSIDLEQEEVFGIPRKYWGCQYIKTQQNKMVRMVTKCPEGTSKPLKKKCEATSNSKVNHYTKHIPVLNSSGVWYQNVYCALCHGDGGNLVKLNHSLNCTQNSTKEEMLQVMTDGTYTEKGMWVLRINATRNRTCNVVTDLGDFNGTEFLQDCGIALFSDMIIPVESCPPYWEDQDVAQKCRAYTMYTKKAKNESVNSAFDSLLMQVFKNPHCAICNGMLIEDIRCVLPLVGINHRSRFKPPSLSIIMDVMEFNAQTEMNRGCELPDGLWDALHNKCIDLLNLEDEEEEPEEKSVSSDLKINFTCNRISLISLKKSEYERLENGSIKFIGMNSSYTGHIFNEVEFHEDGTALICLPIQHFISGTAQEYLTAFCLTISVICLILHVATYCALPKLCNLPGKNLLSLSWALLFAQLILLVGVRPAFHIPDVLCMGIAVLDHYCFLAAFFWMNVMSVDIWRTFSVSKIRGAGRIKTHHKYAGYAWGCSALISILALIVDLSTESGPVKPFFGTNQLCWFGTRGGLGLFLALPIFLLLMVNLSLFVITIRKIWLTRRQGVSYIRDKIKAELLQTSLRSRSGAKYSEKAKSSANISGRNDQARFYLYMKLFTIMGLTWIFGFIATFTGISILWYPFIIFNGLQGAFIFVMFDVKRNIAFMLWDKYVSKHGYTPPGFIVRTSDSMTKTSSTNSSKITTLNGRSSSSERPESSRTLSSSHSILSTTVT